MFQPALHQLSQGVLWYLAFIVSIVAHEAAHAWAALRLGDATAYRGGQVTLDPLPHIRREPVGTVVVPLLSYLAGGWMIGWASTPYDRNWAQAHPQRSALMALAGPLANLTLLLLTALLIRLGVAYGVFHAPRNLNFATVVASHQPGTWYGLAVLLSIFFSLNLILLVFNLLPLPPMDGSGIIPLFLSREASLRYLSWVQNPTFALLGLLVAWKFFGQVYRPLHLLVVNLLYPGAGYH
jgi:Zn-dependent protease